MKCQIISKLSALMLAFLMVTSVFTVVASADTEKFVSETHDVFSRTSSTIAPGVTQDIVYGYAKDGKQMAYYVATADIARDDVLVQASYFNQFENQTFGMSKLTDQMAYADKLFTNPEKDSFISEYYKAVVGTNGDFYNMSTGKPTGAFVINGLQSSNKANNRPWFAIFEDGTALCGYNNTDWDAAVAAHGAVQQAVGGNKVIVNGGADVSANASGSYDTTRASRTCVGVTADGKVVMMSLDGRQEPFSCGGSMHELAQIMLEAGCVTAINLDGGGSTTFVSRPEGKNEVEIINRPSDGSERSISSALIVASLATPSNVFDRAVLTAENEFVTPGSTVKVSAVGVSPAGTSAEIPQDVTWKLENSSLGTVENGIFTSNGTTGDAVVQLVYDGNVVGKTTIKVVIPEAISFNQTSIVVPYGRSIDLSITATYGLNEVAFNDSDINITLSDSSVGTIKGLVFTAGEEGVAATNGKLTAELVSDTSVACEASITLGKGSEVIWDFEESYEGWLPKDKHDCDIEIGLVTKDTGKVHNGNSALAVTIDYSQTSSKGWIVPSLWYKGERVYIPDDAIAMGMWVYVPEEAVGGEIDFRPLYYDESGAIKRPDFVAMDLGYATTIDESGWHYFSVSLEGMSGLFIDDTVAPSDNAFMEFYNPDRDNSTYDYDFSDYSSVNGKFTYYIDDITFDYSTAVDDRDEPTFENMTVGYYGLSDAVTVSGQTIDQNVVSFSVKASENTYSSNYSGLDLTSAKAYIDGVDVTSSLTYSDTGLLTISDATLADGVHSIKFSIEDKMGNYASIIRQINIQADSGMPTIKVIAKDDTLDRIKIGSLYYVDIVATDIEKVQKVVTDIDLNSVSTWELDHMTVAEGFTASYVINSIDNIATLTITRTENTSVTGESVLVSMPIRTWIPSDTACSVTSQMFWPMDIRLNVDYGAVTLVDGKTDSFSGAEIQVDTELYAQYADMDKDYYASLNGSWHIHAAEALEDEAATCTEDGYTGRTYCEECASVVDWGTTVETTGHTYVVTDGVLKCGCGETKSGEYEGKLYIDGVAASGWIDNSYYADGVKFTGVKEVDGYYYNFDDNGVCEGKTKYTGLFYDTTSSVYRYAKIGELASGWIMIDNEWHYFFKVNMAAAVGTHQYGDVVYTFDETGKLESGVWRTTEEGTMYYYGPNHYIKEWATINGEKYYFDSNGYRSEGYQIIKDSWTNPEQWYHFSDEGVLIEKLTSTGLIEIEGNLYYLIDGISQYGLYCIDGYYYYFNSSFAAVTGTYYITKTNGLMDAGNYNFDEDGKMIFDGLRKINGELYYYENGELTRAGLIEINGSYYYINSAGKAVTGTYYITNTNGLMDAGNYNFDEDGKMIIE